VEGRGGAGRRVVAQRGQVDRLAGDGTPVELETEEVEAPGAVPRAMDEEETRCSHGPREDILPAFRMRNGTPSKLAAAVALACIAPAARALQDASAPEDVALTIRADGTAAIREVRSAQLVAGENRVRIYDVSPKIAAETVMVRSLASPELLDL